MLKPKLAFAANREIGMRALQILLELRWYPQVILVPEGDRADLVGRMRELAPGVPFIEGKEFGEPHRLRQLARLDLDYLVSVHFPYIVPAALLELPKIGAFNLHPAYLPQNRGWHTPTWAILDQTRYGATFHWLNAELDAGDIVIQEELEIRPSDTAHSLYQRVLALEEVVFRKAVPLLLSGTPPRIPQTGSPTSHSRADIRRARKLDLAERRTVGDVLDQLRALTTNTWSEAAYFEIEGQRYHVRVQIEESDALGTESDPT